ncbi:Glucose dehydrogenase [FAD, quinone] [Blattella germanica]|nr:Glucose dehydrogenase [FAD, quinone] [Blattella germanica]
MERNGVEFHNRILKGVHKVEEDEGSSIPEGAGAAGCLLANRLSEDPNISVLLIEAGGEETFIQDIPALSSLPQLTPANWGYQTEKLYTACLGLIDERCRWPRGKVLGGSTTINYMVYTRGNKADFDTWASLGNEGWSYHEVLPYFLKFEKMMIPKLAKDTKYHSSKGELYINHPRYHSKSAELFVESANQTGHKIVDYNGEEQVGYSIMQGTLKNGIRWSANSAFLKPVRHRKNLKVLTHSLVTKILIHSGNKTAYGVEYKRWSLLNMKAFARKEVILAAGVINSPQLLMLSGIGPKSHLEDVGIPLLQDLKVGYNLLDHYGLGNLIFTANSSIGIRFDNILHDLKEIENFIISRKGLLTITGGLEAIGFEDIDGDDVPDLEFAFAGTTIGSLLPVLLGYGEKPCIHASTYLFSLFEDVFSVFPVPLKPKSRGRLMLKDNNPFSKPLLYHNYFTDPYDMHVLLIGIRRAIALTEAPAFRKYGVKLYDKSIPQCKQYDFNSDEYWECNARYVTYTMFHQAGTCKMGPDSDAESVVDPSLKVRGINNLRVIDSSIFPVLISGHTQAPTYMVAEKGAYMIKEYWKVAN